MNKERQNQLHDQEKLLNIFHFIEKSKYQEICWNNPQSEIFAPELYTLINHDTSSTLQEISGFWTNFVETYQRNKEAAKQAVEAMFANKENYHGKEFLLFGPNQGMQELMPNIRFTINGNRMHIGKIQGSGKDEMMMAANNFMIVKMLAIQDSEILSPKAAATFVEGLELDFTEKMTLRAWIKRMTEPPTARPHDGIAWDAPGMTPPGLRGKEISMAREQAEKKRRKK